MSNEWKVIKREEDGFIELFDGSLRWIAISKWGKDHVLVNASSNCLVPIDVMKMFLEELQKFIKEIEEEVMIK